MAGFTVEYLINLRDQFSASAERVMKSANEARAAIGNMGKASSDLDGQLSKSAAAMSRISSSAEKAATAVGSFTKANSRAAQESARFAELQIAQMNRIEKREMQMYESHVARQNLIKSGAIPGPKEKGGGLGFMGGMLALSMLHNDVTKDWTAFDDEMRKMRGTMAGQLSDSDIAALRKSAIETARGTLFTGTDIAKIMMAEAERGVPLNEVVKQGAHKGQLLGGVIAKQMLGIATATGEDPAKTFETHLAIARGFEMPFSAFPHISDTIARVHQKTGVTLKQIETQMGQIAAYAHSAGWTEEQTIGTVGFLAKRGMGQYAGSGLARIISKSLNWSKPAAEAWRALGIKKDDIIDPRTGGMLNPADLVRLISEHTKHMSPAEVAGHLNKMFGDRGQKVAAAFANAVKTADPDELRKMIEDLTNVDGLAEKMGVEGSKGGAAGLKKFTAAWENLKIAIGDSGFGDHVGWLSSKFGDMFDRIADGPSWGKEATGWVAGGLNMLSSAALPIIALGSVGSLVQGLAKLTGIADASTGLWSAVGALRAMAAITGAGALIFLGYEIYQHWDQVKKVLSEVWALMKNIATGNATGARKNAETIAQAAGFGSRHEAVLDNMRFNARRRHHGIDVIGIEGRSYLATQERMRHAQDLIAEARALKARYHPTASPTFHGFGPRGGGASAADAAAAGRSAAAQRVQADVNVRSTIDPIQVNIPASVTLQGTLSGLNGLTANVNGSMPLSATAPRGQTMAEPEAPRVSK